MGQPILVLIVLSILPAVLCAESKEQRWRCTGELSGYTNSYCERHGDVPGCYYVLHFSYFRSCASICNDIVVGSIDQQRCDSECSHYLYGEGGCTPVVESDTTTTTITTTTTTSTTTTMKPLPAAQTEDVNNNNNTITIVVVVLAFAVIVAAVGVYCKRKRIREKFPGLLKSCQGSKKKNGQVALGDVENAQGEGNGGSKVIDGHPVQVEATFESTADHGDSVQAGPHDHPDMHSTAAPSANDESLVNGQLGYMQNNNGDAVHEDGRGIGEDEPLIDNSGSSGEPEVLGAEGGVTPPIIDSQEMEELTVHLPRSDDKEDRDEDFPPHQQLPQGETDSPSNTCSRPSRCK